MERIDSVLKRVLKKIGIDRRINEGIILKEWDNLVGKEIAIHTRPIGIKSGVLFIKVDDAIWANELNFLKWEIIDVLNKKVEEKIVKNIYIKTG
ncbi:MAG: DUF721 domain-containing protein [bacterium]|nr:DUF721 domain-containing protein [bacterium]